MQNHSILERIAAPAGSPLPLPRILLVFAHPDDEVIAVGGRLERFSASRFLCVTDGAPRDGADAAWHGFQNLDAYRAARRAEQQAALRHAGLAPGCSASLAIADKEAMLQLPALARALAREMEQFAPEVVLTHPYEGGHPDHDSCAFAVQAAVRLLGRFLPVLEAPFYYAGPDGMTTGCFVAGGPTVLTQALTAGERKNKQQRFACFPSQAEVLKNFATTHEQYRLGPEYDFTEPPHPGRLLYEQWGWEIDGAHFRSLAGIALHELGLA